RDGNVVNIVKIVWLHRPNVIAEAASENQTHRGERDEVFHGAGEAAESGDSEDSGVGEASAAGDDSAAGEGEGSGAVVVGGSKEAGGGNEVSWSGGGNGATSASSPRIVGFPRPSSSREAMRFFF